MTNSYVGHGNALDEMRMIPETGPSTRIFCFRVLEVELDSCRRLRRTVSNEETFERRDSGGMAARSQVVVREGRKEDVTRARFGSRASRVVRPVVVDGPRPVVLAAMVSACAMASHARADPSQRRLQTSSNDKRANIVRENEAAQGHNSVLTLCSTQASRRDGHHFTGAKDRI